MTIAEVALDDKPVGPKPRHQLTMYGDIQHKQRKEWLVRDLLGAGELSCMYGPPGCGKSVLAGDLATHSAAGELWFGRQVTQGAVLYVAAERSQIVMRRFAAIRIAKGWKRLPLEIVSGLVDLRSNKIDGELIVGYAKTLQRNTSLGVNLIVIDTLSRALNGGDENSPKDMGAFVAEVTRIQEATRAHILVVHHVPHEAMRMRGHGSMHAACDSTLRVEKQKTVRTAILEKSNDTVEGAGLAFTLKGVELDRDDDGRATDAPVVVPCDAATYEAIKPVKQLSSSQRLALDALANCILDHGQPSPASFQLPAGIKAVTVDVWKAELFSRGILEREAKNPREPFRRLKLALLGQHIIGERDDFIWMAKQGLGR